MLIVQKQLPGLCHQPRPCQEPGWQYQHESSNNIVHLASVFYIFFYQYAGTVAMPYP